MAIDFLSLPPNIHNDIFVFVDDRSLLRMREVSKLAKDIADCSIVKARKTEINDFQVIKYTNVLHATLTVEELERLFASLKPLIQLTEVDVLCLPIKDPETMRICSTLFMGKNIESFSVNASEISDNSSLFEFTKQVRVKLVECVINKEYIEQCMQLADMVNSLFFIVENNEYPQNDVVSIIGSILRRKCDLIHFFIDTENSYSLSEAESLIKMFHHSGKTVKFTATTDEEPMEAQIGEYLMKIDSGRYTNLEIEHMNWV